MTNETPSVLKFFVFIIESPSAPDLYHGRSESSLLAQAARLDDMPCETRTAINPAAFVAAFRFGLADAMKSNPSRLPILHISAHGGQTGIQLSDGSVVTWADLRTLLLPVNQSLGGLLVLCMSACEGYAACRMAMHLGNEPHPYFALIANYGKPLWSDTAVAYAALYHLISKGHSFPDAVNAMKLASGDQGWVLESAEAAKQVYAGYVANLNLPQAQQQLEASAEAADVPPEAKALEHNAG
jgi:hypothetical protein